MSDDTTKALSDIDDILDQTIDDLADYVPFDPFPVGDYRCQFTYEGTTIGEKELPAVRVILVLLDVVEMADRDAVAPEPGRKVFLPPYILAKKDGDRNTFGEGQLKDQILLPLREVFTPASGKISDLLAEADGCQVMVTLGIRRRKNKETGEIIPENVLKAMVVDS